MIDYDIKVKIDGKKLIPSRFIKYLGLYIDCHLDWSIHVNVLSSKLSRATGMLSKVRHYIEPKTILSIYYAIFSSIMNYGSIIWGQNSNTHIKRIETIQNKAIRIINFKPYNTPSNHLYKESKILKFTDGIKLKNFLLVVDNVNNNLPFALQNSFTPAKDIHNYRTRATTFYKMSLPKINKVTYGEYSISYQATKFWNSMVTKFPEEKLHLKSKPFCKTFIICKLLELYE